MRGRIASLTLLLAVLTAGSAGAQWHQGLTDRGLDSLRQATVRDSVDAEAQYRYGLGLWEKRRYDQADSAFRHALRLQETHAGAHLALGALPFGRGARFLFDLPGRIGRDSVERYFRSARRHTRNALALEPTVDLSALRFLSDVDLVPDGGGTICVSGMCAFVAPDTKWPKPTRRAVRQLVTGRPDSAFTLLTAALATRRQDEILPDDFIWYYALAADRSGHPQEAADGYRELAQRASRREAGQSLAGLSPQGRETYLLLYGMASERAGNVAVGRAALREALLVDLALYQAHSRLADIAESQGDVQGAVTERRSAIAIAPEVSRLHVDLGITLLQAGMTQEAKEALAEAVRLTPWDPVAQLFLFQTAIALNDRETATQALAGLERYAPLRNRDQVAEARTRLAELP